MYCNMTVQALKPKGKRFFVFCDMSGEPIAIENEKQEQELLALLGPNRDAVVPMRRYSPSNALCLTFTVDWTKVQSGVPA
jgi:hypothetical protein